MDVDSNENIYNQKNLTFEEFVKEVFTTSTISVSLYFLDALGTKALWKYMTMYECPKQYSENYNYHMMSTHILRALHWSVTESRRLGTAL